MSVNTALRMEVKIEKSSQNGSPDSQKMITQAASTINQIANKLANSKAQQNSASEKLTQLSLALAVKPASVSIGTNSSSQPPTQLAIITSQSQGGTIAIVTSQPTSSPNQISLLTSQPQNISSNSTNQNPHAVVSKMTEVLSLKQSPTLTKQLTTPISGTTNKVQVITAYMCRYCGQQFDSPSAMQIHIQNHVNGKTPHMCSVCGKEYRTPSKLQRHVRVHSGERPYACSVCGRRFTRSDHVKQHMKVHLQIKDLNVCRLCNEMKFNRRQTLHLHLQQHHLMQSVFTCHRCGEAYESLGEMQSHKLTHDSVLNSLKDDGQRSLNAPLGIAKFALGPQKIETVNKFEPLKTEKEVPVENKTISILDKIGPNGIYIPANLDNVTGVGNKIILEGMTKDAVELQIQKQYREELMQMQEETDKLNSQSNVDDKRKELEQQIKIANCFTLKPDGTGVECKTDIEMGEDEDDCNRQGTTVVSEDGMSMFILPGSTEEGDGESKDGDDDEDDDDLEEMDGMTIVMDSSKESGIGEENDDGQEKMDESGSDINTDTKAKSDDQDESEAKISSKATNNTGGYSRPCPKSKKRGYVQELNNNHFSGVEHYPESKLEGVSAPKATSLLNSKLTELIKAKVEQNLNSNININQIPTVVTTTNTYQRILPHTVSALPSLANLPKLTLIPNATTSGTIPAGTLQSYFLPISSGSVVIPNMATKAAGSMTQTRIVGATPARVKQEPPKLIRCEHCCIWFEDNAMSMLHNTLHAADEADPFTCRKCMKKLGNRLEFMAHMVWHLEPNMDI